MSVKERLNKLEQQVKCPHDWRPWKKFHMGTKCYHKKCYRCDLQKSIDKEEYVALLEKELKEEGALK